MKHRDFPCFRYKDADFSAPLFVESLEGVEYVRCLQPLDPFRLTPEEGIRQAILWFMIAGAEQYATINESLRFAVEKQSLDLTFYLVNPVVDHRFNIDLPVLIFETKRIERDVANDHQQLEKYLRRHRCTDGMLFNGRQAVWMSLPNGPINPEYQTEILSDLCEVESRVLDSIRIHKANFDRCRQYFDSARDGDFSALKELVTRFGWDPSLDFSISIRDENGIRLVNAFRPRVKGQELVQYRIRGTVTHRAQCLNPKSFDMLHAVRQI